MHVVVVGCGRVGSELAVTLDSERHTVAVLDKNRNAFRRLPNRFTGRPMLGFRLVALTRAGQARLVTPSLVGQEGDILHLAVRTDAVEELRARLGDASEGVHT